MEDVRSVLESSSKLSGVHGEFEVLGVLAYVFIIEDGRHFFSIVVVIDEVGHGALSLFTEGISSRDIISQTQDAIAIAIGDARLNTGSRESPIVRGGRSSALDVSKMIISGPAGE